MKIERDLTVKLRGVAILLICLHNLFHLMCYFQENEFYYYPQRAIFLVTYFKVFSWSVIESTFSYFGWYGVPIFVFLSGYGLACKYEHRPTSLRPLPYIWHSFIKLWILMVPAYFLYMVARKGLLDTSIIIQQLTFTINFLQPEKIFPGVFWYFGLTFQLYLCYLLFYYVRSNRLLLLFVILSLALGMLQAYLPLSDSVEGMRKNCILWFPVFLFGLYVGRIPHVAFIDFADRHFLWCFPLLTLIWLSSTIIHFLWPFSPLFPPLLLYLLLKRIRFSWFNRIFLYIGSISAGMFVMHPVIRVYAFRYRADHNFYYVALVYLAIVILTAAIYTPAYNWLMRKIRMKTTASKEGAGDELPSSKPTGLSHD